MPTETPTSMSSSSPASAITSAPKSTLVQRSAEDQTMLVATYDGEHNHSPPAEIEAGSHSQLSDSCLESLAASRNLGPATTNSTNSSAKPGVTLDLIKPVEETKLNRPRTGSVVVDGRIIRPVSQQFTVEQMASSLSNDPGFKDAVAAAISGRMMGSGNNSMVMKWL